MAAERNAAELELFLAERADHLLRAGLRRLALRSVTGGVAVLAGRRPLLIPGKRGPDGDEPRTAEVSSRPAKPSRLLSPAR